MAVTYKKPIDDDVPWEQRLANYSGNKDAGMNEYQRALEVYRGKSAAGDTEGANAAKKWSDQVNTAIGGIGNNRTAQINNTTDNIGQRVNAKPFEFKQTAAPFQYNAQSDPAYQAALREAQANASTAAGNISADLNKRGIMDSTVNTNLSNQAAQREYTHVSNDLLPQLMQQAYGRYQDQNNNDYRNQLANYQAGQDQIGNLTKYAGTLNGLNQQEADNEQRSKDNAYRDNTLAETQKQNNYDAYLKSVGITGDLGTGPKNDYMLLGDKSGNPSFAGQQYADNKVQQEFENKMKTQLQGANIANMSADNARGWAAESRAAGNQQLGQLFDVWDRTGVAPAGIPGVQAGTRLQAKQTQTQNNNQGVGSLVGDIDQMTPENRKKFFAEQKSNIISEHGLSGFNQLYDSYFDKYGDPK
ncbi:hypothetical protein [Paenibacillus alba]|uniref:Tail fiber domain-containing protein n=1 Tax=Paenibacillus alba TaxID=1197127 RepID=A0ABU6GAG7_9BACL|nr:hypothetical protein [Paenibacillus alba]MEC0231187.1 hypothetical protein [Paenibacillus alba]